MKYQLAATILVGALASGAAFAQTTAPSTPPATTTPPTTITPPVTTGTTLGAPPTTMGTTNTPTTGTAPAAVTTTTAPSRTNAAPVAGANSFTMSQARSKIEDKGFANVTNLKKDSKGVWRGTAMKSGKSVAVALDYQGNVVGH